MSQVYYIIVTVIFALFVILMAWWLYRYMRKPPILSMSADELSDDQKAMIYKFCGEHRRSRLAKEKEEALARRKQEQADAATKKSRKKRS